MTATTAAAEANFLRVGTLICAASCANINYFNSLKTSLGIAVAYFSNF